MKNFKTALSFILVLLMLASILSSCSHIPEEGIGTTTADPATTPLASEESTTPEESTTSAPPAVKVPKSLKILAIGNSFSTDAMEYLCQMLKAAGVESVTLGNLYHGGCTVDQHLGYASADSASYTYYKTTTGAWSSTKNAKMSTALADEEWDFITFQQSSKTSGLNTSYNNLGRLVSHVRSKCPNAKFVWHMTWAYQQDSTHSSFPNYDNDQMKMYNMIVDCVEEVILKSGNFDFVIPCGTAIQNARTSFLGDTLTRDGYHMDYNIGRYILGLTWCAAFTGIDLANVTYNPAPSSITEDMVNVAREAAMNAIAKPYEVTQSKITSGEGPSKNTTADPSIELNPQDFYEQDKATAQSHSIDLSNYTLLEWDHLNNTYWNCTSRATVYTPAATASTYNQNVCSSRKYSVTELPHGTVFICDEGWQYRLDIFPNATSKYSGTRPGMITARLFVLSDDHLKGCTYMGWNVASYPKKDISSIFNQAASHLRIYVPNKTN